MDYIEGFSFTLDKNNKNWENYFEKWKKKNNENTIGVYSVVNYFYNEIKDSLQKVFENEKQLCSLNAFFDNSVKLSKKTFNEWNLVYNDLLTYNESCCIAIPGYLYKGTPMSCYSFVIQIAKKQVILTNNISLTDYANLVETLFILRFGKKPQDCFCSNIEYFVPSQQIVSSKLIAKKEQINLNTIEFPKVPEIEISDFYKIKLKTKYFVLHTADIYGKTNKTWVEGLKGKDSGHATGYIWGDGDITWLPNTSLEEEFGATKQEYEQKTTTPVRNILGTMIHMGMNYDTRNNGHPSDEQYETLARIYFYIYKKNNRKLIIVSHREVDRGITRYKGKDNRAHDDPWNFDLKKFYDLLFNKYDITIIEGVDGMTLERFEEPSRPENKIHWPPVLKGPVEND